MSLLLDKTGHSLWPPDKSPRFLAIRSGTPFACFNLNGRGGTRTHDLTDVNRAL